MTRPLLGGEAPEDAVPEALLDRGGSDEAPRRLDQGGAGVEIPDDHGGSLVLERAALVADVDRAGADADAPRPADVGPPDARDAVEVDLEREEVSRGGVVVEDDLSGRALVPGPADPAVGLAHHAALDLREHKN